MPSTDRQLVIIKKPKPTYEIELATTYAETEMPYVMLHQIRGEQSTFNHGRFIDLNPQQVADLIAALTQISKGEI